MGSWSDLKGGVLARVQSAYHLLLPIERQVADFILANREMVSHMSIQDLAKSAATSKSSVSRFCQKVGYDGFREFRQAMIKDLVTGIPQVHEAVQATDDTTTVIKKICQANAEASNETSQILDPYQLEKAARLISEAKRVLIFGDGPVAVVSIDLYHKLLRLGISCIFVQDRRFVSIQTKLTGPEDVVVGISFSGAARGTVAALQTVKENGTPTISLTNNLGSPLELIADVKLTGTTRVDSEITGTIEPRTSQLCVVDSLFMAIISTDRRKYLEILSKTRKVIVDDWIG